MMIRYIANPIVSFPFSIILVLFVARFVTVLFRRAAEFIVLAGAANVP